MWFVENPTNDSPEILIDVNPNQGGSDSITNSIRGYTWVNKAEENVMIDGVKALKISGVLEGQMNAVYIIVRPNYVYTIHSYKDNYQTLEQMISTIQFN